MCIFQMAIKAKKDPEYAKKAFKFLNSIEDLEVYRGDKLKILDDGTVVKDDS